MRSGQIEDLDEVAPGQTGTSSSLRSETGSLAVLGMLTRIGQGGSVLLAAAILEPAQFGRLGVLIGCQVLAMMLAGQWFEPAVVRSGSTQLNRSGSAPSSLVDSVRRIQWLGSGASMALAFGGAVLLGSVFAIPTSVFALALGAAVVRSFGLFLPTSFFRAVGDVRSVQVLMSWCWGLAFVLRVGGALLFPDSPVGFFVGDLIAASVFAAVAFWTVGSIPRRLSGAVQSVSVGWRDAALLPHFAAVWMLGYIDRFVLFGSIDDHLLGRYEISYQLAALVGITALELSRSAMAQYALAAREQSSSLRNELQRAEVAFLLLVVGAASCGSGVAALLWSSVSVLEGYGRYDGTLGIVAAAQLPLAAYSLAAIKISNVTGDTQRLWVASSVGAITGFAALTLVVPTTDLRLVAVATLVGFLAMMVVAWLFDTSETRRRKLYVTASVAAASFGLAASSRFLHDSASAMVFQSFAGAAAIGFGLWRWAGLPSSGPSELLDLTKK